VLERLDPFLDPLTGTGRFEVWTCFAGLLLTALCTIFVAGLLFFMLVTHRPMPEWPGLLAMFGALAGFNALWFVGWRYYSGKRAELLRHRHRGRTPPVSPASPD
jgi:hypothetical protein